MEIKNTHTAKIALLPTFTLSPGQTRTATEVELSQMNKQVVIGMVKQGMLAAPDLEKAIAEAEAEAEAAEAEAEAAKEPAAPPAPPAPPKPKANTKK